MISALNDFLGQDCILFVNAICKKERVLIKIKPKRATKYGDFRPSLKSNTSHTVTVNQGENKDAFFLTLLHELAHAIVWNKYGRKVKPHGKEWKEDYRILMLDSLEKGYFSENLYPGLIGFANNIKSSHNYNTELVKALNSLNKNDDDFHLISEIEKGSRFIYRDKVYVKGDKIRTRYKCRQKNTLKEYLFNANASVTLFNPN